MTTRVYLTTERLLLRDWTDDDAEPFARLNADPRVMEFFPRALDRDRSDAFLKSNRDELHRRGYGKYAVEEKASGRFLGYVGLAEPNFVAKFTPAIEIGWRLSRESWGQGYATEAAAAVRDYAFSDIGLAEIVSFTTEWNQPSRRVMEKIGMIRDPADDFIHPNIPAGHKLAPHVLYRLDRNRWSTLIR